jgi:hypothetical protein
VGDIITEQQIDAYNFLNKAVNTVFFTGRLSDRPVYLDPEGSVRVQICEAVGCDVDDLDEEVGKIVSATLTLDVSNVYSWHTSRILSWDPENEAPPFSALLLSLSIAAKHMREDPEFSPTNYYGRLAEVYGDASLRAAISFAGKHTKPFWLLLNQWLLQHDFIYGRPTAQQISHLKYVSFAISQALVRETDRDSFKKLFQRYGFTRSDQLTEAELLPYLADWMDSSDPSGYLKGIWQKDNLREKVLTAALQELDSWEGFAADGGSVVRGARKLFWSMKIKRSPVKKVLMYLCTNGLVGESGTYEIAESTSASTRAVIGEDHDRLSFAELPGADASFLSPTSSINLGRLLLGKFSVSGEGEALFERNPRPIMPFSPYSAGHYYREVSQVLLHERYGILCHENWKQRVEEYLNAYARDSFSVLKGRSSGLPAGWTLFDNVEIVAIPDVEIEKDLQDLVPLDKGATIHVLGGLPLSRDVWHAELPPDVYATDGDESLLLKVFEPGLRRGKAKAVVEDSASRPNFLSTSGLDLPNSSLTMVAYSGNSAKTEKTISFRTANNPRRYAKGEEAFLLYAPDKFGSAELANDEIPVNYPLSGHVWCEKEPPLSGEKIGLDQTVLDLSFVASPRGDQWLEIMEPAYLDSSDSGAADECINRGFHIWNVPYGVGKRTKEAILYCSECGSSILWKPRKVKQTQNRSPTFVPGTVKKVIVDHSEVAPNADQIYDAMCYQGFGSWASLQRLLDHLVDEPWKAFEKAKEFADLGLVDLRLDPLSHKPTGWSIPGPALVLAGDDRLYLSGYRSRNLVKEIRAELDRIGLTYVMHSEEGIPSYLRWSGVFHGADEVGRALGQISDPYGRQVSVSNNFAERLVTLLPKSDVLQKQFVETSMPTRRVSRYNPAGNTWEQIQGQCGPGAYRFDGPPRKYYIVDNQESVSYSTFELAKIQAASRLGFRLHDYDLESATFISALGCDLPSLYRRALVSCSGRLPVFGENNTVRYDLVPSEVGQTILNKIYG